MSHLEQRQQSDLDEIRSGIASIGDRVGVSLKDAIHALVIGDADLASRTILGDLGINRAVRELDRKCHAFVAVHLPGAGPLRYVSSVLRMNVALERVGDYAVTICREVVQLSQKPSDALLRDVDLVGDQARQIFKQAMHAFNDENAELARGTIGMAEQIEATFQKVFEDLVAAGREGSSPIKDLFGLLVAINRLGRVSSQAKNICEETIYAATGETKMPKVYRLLFVDSTNTVASRIAEAYAHKAFPERGRFDSAGWSAAEADDPRVSSSRNPVSPSQMAARFPWPNEPMISATTTSSSGWSPGYVIISGRYPFGPSCWIGRWMRFPQTSINNGSRPRWSDRS